MKVWFEYEPQCRKHGTVLRWLYDIWYEIQDDESGRIYLVYPEFIEWPTYEELVQQAVDTALEKSSKIFTKHHYNPPFFLLGPKSEEKFLRMIEKLI